MSGIPSGPERFLPDQGDPAIASCDVCSHRHACYVGGQPAVDPAGSLRWERHVCLGCLMRAGDPVGRSSCSDCTFPVRDAAMASGRTNPIPDGSEEKE